MSLCGCELKIDGQTFLEDVYFEKVAVWIRFLTLKAKNLQKISLNVEMATFHGLNGISILFASLQPRESLRFLDVHFECLDPGLNLFPWRNDLLCRTLRKFPRIQGLSLFITVDKNQLVPRDLVDSVSALSELKKLTINKSCFIDWKERVLEIPHRSADFWLPFLTHLKKSSSEHDPSKFEKIRIVQFDFSPPEVGSVVNLSWILGHFQNLKCFEWSPLMHPDVFKLVELS